MIVLWGRVGDAGSAQAQAFLQRHGYRPDSVRDVDRSPPTPSELERLRFGLGSLRALAVASPDVAEEDLAAWLAADPARIKAPVLMTPKGALAGFRERAWMDFLGLGRTRG